MPPAPAAAPFRDRPVLEHIVEQHAEEAAFLWTLRDAATDAPHYKRHHLARLDERVEAHVDGLRVAGEAGWRIALEQLERRCEKGELFAAGVLALESGDMRRIEPLVARAEAEPEARRGFVGAVAWCKPNRMAGSVRAWAGSAAGFERYLALCACSVHRVHPGPNLSSRLEDGYAPARSRALRLCGELGEVERLDQVLGPVGDPDRDASFWSAWSAVLLGDRGRALGELERVAVGDGPYYEAALEMTTRAMEVERGAAFIRSMKGSPGLQRAMVVACGHSGNPAALPWLIARMQDAPLARAAGEAFSTVTGIDLARADLEMREPFDDGRDEVRHDPAGGAPEADPDENLPWPDPRLIADFWDSERHRYAPGKRYLLGRPIDEASSRQASEEGFQRQRRAGAYERSLLGAAVLRPWRARAAVLAEDVR